MNVFDLAERLPEISHDIAHAVAQRERRPAIALAGLRDGVEEIRFWLREIDPLVTAAFEEGSREMVQK